MFTMIDILKKFIEVENICMIDANFKTTFDDKISELRVLNNRDYNKYTENILANFSWEIKNRLEDCEYVYVSVGLEKQGEIGHANFLIFQQYKGVTYMGMYEPHGYRSIYKELYNQIYQHLGKTLKISRISGQETCPFGLQRSVEEDPGFCAIISFYWFICFVKISRALLKKGIHNPMYMWTRYIEEITNLILIKKNTLGTDPSDNISIKRFLLHFGYQYSSILKELTKSSDVELSHGEGWLNRHTEELPAGKQTCQGDYECSETNLCVNNYCCSENDIEEKGSLCNIAKEKTEGYGKIRHRRRRKAGKYTDIGNPSRRMYKDPEGELRSLLTVDNRQREFENALDSLRQDRELAKKGKEREQPFLSKVWNTIWN
jgi:hypothetical protein